MTEIQNVAYVRPEGEYLTEQAPPRSSEGIIGWMNANLFATWSDRIVTAFVAVSFVWLAWSAIDDWFISANWTGATQAEGQMAEIISDVEAKLEEARRLEQNWSEQAERLVADENQNLANLIKDIEVTNWQAQEVVSNFRGSFRKLPGFIDEQITIAQSKLPLSAYARLETVRRQLRDPRVESAAQVQGLYELNLSAQEQATLIEMSRPWTALSDEDKVIFQSQAKAISNLLSKTETVSGEKVLLPLDSVLEDVDALVAEVNGEGLLERPTRISLQFASLVDGVVGTPMTNIPVSRIQKMRKDTLTNVEIDAIRQALASEVVGPAPEGASRFQLNAHNKKVDAEADNITDGMVFLNRDMPAGYDEAIENQGMLRALDAMDFWSAARLVAEPEGVEPESNLPPLKAPLVYSALEAQFPTVQPGPESYAGSTHALVEAYLENDLEAMKAAWRHFEPLTTWASGNDGSNWAVIGKNWTKLLWGTYPEESLWRVGLVLVGLILAALPIVSPMFRNTAFFVWAGIYPLFLLFMLGGLSIRLYGWSVPEDANLFQTLYSELGRVYQALIALAVAVAAFVLQRGALGKTAGPALVVAQFLAFIYFIIMMWGTVINPKAAQSNILVDNNFTGLLTADHPLGQQVSADNLLAEIDRLNNLAADDSLSPDEAQALRREAQQLRTGVSKARTAERDFANVVKKGEGTFVVLPFVKSLEWGGLLVTMVLGVLGMAASLPIGIILAFGRQSTLPIVRWFSTGFIEVIRGVPLIALLLIVTFVLPKLLPDAEYSKLGLVFVAICVFGGVYQAEVVRGGLQSLPRGQYEAAQAMGLNFWQMSRLITLPQALKAVIPAIVNTFIGLFKDTTLVIVVGILDFLTVADAQITAKNAWNATKPETLLVISLVFFVLMFSLSRYSMWLERRLATDHR